MHAPFVMVGVSQSDKEDIGEIFEVMNFKLSFSNQSNNLRNFILERRVCLKLNENTRSLVSVLRQFIAWLTDDEFERVYYCLV